MKLHITLLLVLFGFGINSSHAQQDEQLSLYMYNKLQFNPAYAGSRDAISTIAIARFQWVGFEGAPSTQWFSIHAPLLQKSLGVGMHLVNDQIGKRKRTGGYLDLSGSIALNDRSSRLALGVSVGFDNVGFDFSDALVNDPQDPFYGQGQYSVIEPNLGAGIYFHSDKHYFSLSVPRLLEASAETLSTVTAPSIVQQLNTRHFFISGGYIFDLNSVFKLKPTTLVKYTPGAPLTVDANLSLLMYNKLWAGLMYRFHESMGVNIVYNIKNTISVGYVYDFPINGLRNYQTGSHEIFLRYDFTKSKTAFTSPRYF
ncbi:MAG: type IX secretion system PorP/SprF family membrane protein [Flavobacteriaceae bacterium]|jgi:type IX secretion system PorP/SprF family membrane protein